MWLDSVLFIWITLGKPILHAKIVWQWHWECVTSFYEFDLVILVLTLRVIDSSCVSDWSTSCRKLPGCLRRRSTRKRRAASSRWVTLRTSTMLPRRTESQRRHCFRLLTSTRVARDSCSTSSTVSTNSVSLYVFLTVCAFPFLCMTYAGINTSSLASVAERPRGVSCLSVFNSAIYAIFLLLVIRFQIYQRVGHNEILFLRRSRPCSVAGCDKKIQWCVAVSMVNRHPR